MRRIFAYLQRLFGIRPKVKKSIVNTYSKEKTAKTLRELQEFMQSQQPYLNPGYNIKSLAQEMGMPPYQLSAFLNRQVGVNFNDFINRYRILYCKELIHKGDDGGLNLKGLAAKCGFHNRNTFTIAFKKFTGYTPSVYAKQFKMQNYKSGKIVFFGNIAEENFKEISSK